MFNKQSKFNKHCNDFLALYTEHICSCNILECFLCKLIAPSLFSQLRVKNIFKSAQNNPNYTLQKFDSLALENCT